MLFQSSLQFCIYLSLPPSSMWWCAECQIFLSLQMCSDCLWWLWKALPVIFPDLSLDSLSVPIQYILENFQAQCCTMFVTSQGFSRLSRTAWKHRKFLKNGHNPGSQILHSLQVLKASEDMLNLIRGDSLLLKYQEDERNGIIQKHVKVIKPQASQSNGKWPRTTAGLKYLNRVQAM